MGKKVRLHDLRKHDLEKQDCLVRKLEREVDYVLAGIRKSDYLVQFWEDVRLYGLREAFSMLRRFALEQSGDLDLPRRLDELGRQITRAEAALDFSHGIF